MLLDIPISFTVPDNRECATCSAHRWVFEVSLNRRGLFVGAGLQGKYKASGMWDTLHFCMYGVSITKYCCWGIDHSYYDGPHCSFSLGPIHILWSGNPVTNWCKKCAGER